MKTVEKNNSYEELKEMFYKRTVELHNKYGDSYYSRPVYKIETNRDAIVNAEIKNSADYFKVFILFKELENLPKKYRDFALEYSTLFNDDKFSSYFILDRLMMIYNSKVIEMGKAGSHVDYKHVLNYKEKTAALKRTFNILKSLDNREDILKSFLHNTTSHNFTEVDKKKKMWYYLLNDASFLDVMLSISDFRKQNPKYDENTDIVLFYQKYKHLYEKYDTDVLEKKIESFLIQESQSR